MATTLFTWYAVDGDQNGIAGGSFNGNFLVSNTPDGIGDPTSISAGDTVWVSLNGGAFFECRYEGALAAPSTVSGFVFLQPVGTEPLFIASNEEFDDFMEYSVDASASLPVCFAAGTQIATPQGERAVETLAIGDPITTASGATVPVKWIGQQTVHKLFTPAEHFAPVRITAGALGDGLPHTDLVLTADHALILDGLAIHASALANGTTIHRDPVDSLPERVTYYHIETEGHEVILANGAPAETYVDNVARRAFDNYQDYLDLYGPPQQVAEMDLPRVVSQRQLPRHIRKRLGQGARAA